MKQILLSIATATALFALLSCNSGVPKGFVEEPDDQSPDVVKTFDYGQMAALGHPRVLMTADDFKDLKVKVGRKAAEHKLLSEANDMVIALADEYVTNGEVIEYKLDAAGKRLLSQSRKALKRLFTLAYAYKMTGEQKYLDAAIKDLRDVCAFEDWHPSHYLDTAEMSLAVAIAYDWLYYDLPLDLREMIHKCLVEYGMKTSVGQSYHRAVGNWNQVCNAGMIAAALAVYEKDKAISVDIIEDAVASNKKAMQGIYSPDGNYAEGYGYWHYGTGFQSILMKLLQTAFGNTAGLTEVDGFMKTAGYILFMAAPSGGSFSYADGGTEEQRVLPAMWWFAAESGDEALLANEVRNLKNGMYASTKDRLAAAVPVFLKDCDFKGNTDAVPSSYVWSGNGKVPVTMVHTNWKFDDGDVYLGIKGGAPNGGHGHMDAGSFVFESKGVRWSDDLHRPDYATMENALGNSEFWSNAQDGLRWDLFRMNNIGHSTLAFLNSDKSVKDKRHVTDQIVSGKTQFKQVYNSPDGYGATLDVTPAYADAVESANRTFKVIGGKLVVSDEITAKKNMPAKFQWRMIGQNAVTVNPDGEILTQKGKNLKLSTVSSDKNVKVTYATWDATRPADWIKRDYEPENTDYMIAGFTATVPAGKTVTFTTTLE